VSGHWNLKDVSNWQGVEKMKKLIVLIGLLAVALPASAAITVDGVISAGEWDGYIVTDPSDDSPSNRVEMTRSGMKVEGSYMYWFCELGDGLQWSDMNDSGPYTAIFPGLFADADADQGGQPGDTGTFLSEAWGSAPPNCADSDDGIKMEWGNNAAAPPVKNNHRGIDLNLEVGLWNDWTNGVNDGNNGEGPDGSCYNYWGASDNVSNIQAKVGKWQLAHQWCRPRSEYPRLGLARESRRQRRDRWRWRHRG
jgi:hypothetical protein